MSSCEAELIALVDCVQEVDWAQNIITELLDIKTSNPVMAESDSQCAITTVVNVGMHGRSRHYRRLVAYLQEKVGSQVIRLVYHDGKTLMSDLLTKAINGAQLNKRKEELCLIDQRVKDR